MAQKDEYPVNNRLQELRDWHGLDNNGFKEIGISKELIKKYESNAINLPIDKAIKISQKYKCSLDWLYDNEILNSKNDLLDIHELFKCDDKFIYISIPRKYMKYFDEVNKIEKSDTNDSNKKYDYSKLNKELLDSDKDNEIISVAKIAKNKFINKIKTSNGETYPFDDEYFDEVEDDISPVKERVVKQILNNTNLNEDHIRVISGYIDKIIEGNEKENVFVMGNNEEKSKKLEEFLAEYSKEECTVRARKLSSIYKYLGKLSDEQIDEVRCFIEKMIK